MTLPYVMFTHWADVAPDADAVRFLASGDAVTERLSYRELRAGAEARGAAFAAMGLRGRPVVLAYEAGPEFILTMLGCLRAGAIAVPLPLPLYERARRRFRSVLAFLRPPAVLTTSRVAALADVRDCGSNVVCTDVGWEPAKAMEATPVSADTPAVIQFSSGSTGAPRGLVLSHRNIGANLRMIHETFRTRPGSTCVTWLPHHHDMGLFGTILAALTSGVTVVQMPPEAFLRRPLRWLRAVSDHQAAYSGAPNFGYAICSRVLAGNALAGLDLSHWRTAFVGGEPTQPRTLADFARMAAAANFNADAFLSCYGLAEATLLCSAGPATVVGARVAAGAPVAGCHLLVRPLPVGVDANGGEICVAGDHVSLGVWSGGDDGAVTPHTDAFDGPDGRRYLPTGDIGTLVDDQVVVLDRLKDALPVRGGTIGPGDIESLVMEAVPHVTAAAAVRGPDDMPDSVHVAIEIGVHALSPAERNHMESTIKTHVATAFGIPVGLSLHANGRLPRTTSGKIQRFATRQMIFRREDHPGTATSEKGLDD